MKSSFINKFSILLAVIAGISVSPNSCMKTCLQGVGRLCSTGLNERRIRAELRNTLHYAFEEPALQQYEREQLYWTAVSIKGFRNYRYAERIADIAKEEYDRYMGARRVA